ncbi:MAG: high frequency lysogenization protein HflD [Acidobacteria bacterium]|nr:high frequency lysogenization protein HflD [Acidobacteriota bacterium]
MPDTHSLAELLRGRESDPAFLATALALAFFFGAVHALTPGHGKTLVAAYLVGSRGKLSDAIYLGGVVTATHTVSVFALGLVTLYASTRIAVERIFPWLSLLSGAMVLIIGAWLLWRRLSSVNGQAGGHAAGHSHSHSHGAASGLGLAHSHSHGSLLSLGVSGGLVPCPEAMVVLMLSISMGRLGFGLLLLTSFTLGLAAVLMAIGGAMVLAGGRFTAAQPESAWTKRLPAVSAAVVTALGFWMTWEAATKIYG